MLVLAINVRLEPFPQRSDALRGSICVFALINCLDAGSLDGTWNVEIGLTNRLIGFLSEAANSNTFRMPLESKANVRFAIQEGCVFGDVFEFAFMKQDCFGGR
jgi:hypothetical protein